MSGQPTAGQPPALSRAVVDRMALHRGDERWLRTSWEDPDSLVLVIDDSAPDRPEIDVVEHAEGLRLALVAPSAAPAGERYLLGVDAGRSYWAVTGPAVATAGARRAGLRDVGASLEDRDAGLLVHAVALANWHATHPRCPRCGGPTLVERAGHVRRCERDGSLHFPRVDPAVIMLVHDGGDRVVLAHQARWPLRRFSVLAGFVEPGESVEQAVAREVVEEVGMAVTDVRYAASQPWPFPSSLMLGFTARVPAEDPRLHAAGNLVVDREELEDARWVSRDRLRSALATGDTDLRLPPPVSIAWRLLHDWAIGPAPD